MSSDKIIRVKNEIDETTQIMKKNIDATIERGEKLEDLEDRTNQLVNHSSSFRIKAKYLKRTMCFRHFRLIGLIILIILILAVLITLAIYAKYN